MMPQKAQWTLLTLLCKGYPACGALRFGDSRLEHVPSIELELGAASVGWAKEAELPMPSDDPGQSKHRLVRIDATKLAEILAQHEAFLANQRGGKRAMLKFHDLSGADLSGANFTGSKMRRTDLSGATLFGAILTSADLTEARLVKTDLRGVQMPDACLARANLSS